MIDVVWECYVCFVCEELLGWSVLYMEWVVGVVVDELICWVLLWIFEMR